VKQDYHSESRNYSGTRKAQNYVKQPATCGKTSANINEVKSELPKRVLPQINNFREGSLWKKQDNKQSKKIVSFVSRNKKDTSNKTIKGHQKQP